MLKHPTSLCILLREQLLRRTVDPRHCRPGPHQLTEQQLSPTWCPLFKAMLPSVLGPPDSGSVHTGSVSSVEGSVGVCVSDCTDSPCLRGSVGESEANVGLAVGWLCKSVCADSAGCTVSTGKSGDPGSSGDVEGTDSAGVV